MKLSKAAKIWIDYHKAHSKKNTVRSYQAIIERYIKGFGDGPYRYNHLGTHPHLTEAVSNLTTVLAFGLL